MKHTVAHDKLSYYSGCNSWFDIHTNESDFQKGEVILNYLEQI